MAYQTQVFSGGGRVFVATKHIPTKLHTQVVIDGTIIDISEYQIMNNSLVLNEETEKDVVLRISDNPNEFDDIVIQTTVDGTWGEIVGDVESQEDLTTFLQDNYEIKTSIKNGINSDSPRDVVTISRDNATRTITITPVLAEGYSFCSNNIEYTITETLTRQFPNVQGNYYIYFDEAGVLQVLNEFNDDLLTKYALVDIGYWSVSKQASLNNYEFHTSQINGLWHKQQHETVGAVYAYGFAEVAQDPPQAFDGSSNDDIRVQITSGKMWDEDLPHILGAKALDGNMTLLYRVGSDWEWVSQADSVYNISNVPQWDNEGTMTAHTDGHYGVAIFYKAPFTDDPETVCVMSQGEYATIAEASEACKIRPDITGMPIPEFRALFAKPYKYDSTYTNDSRCTFVPLDDGTDKVLWYWKTGIENAGGGSLGTLSSSDVTNANTYANLTLSTQTQEGFNEAVDEALGYTKKFMIIEEQKPYNQSGGDAIAGINVRKLNTVTYNNITGASLNATTGVFTLPAGTYIIEAIAQASRVDAHQLLLKNITGNITYAGAEAATTTVVATPSTVTAIFTITASKDFRLEHDCHTAQTVYGLGGYSTPTTNTYVNVFSRVKIQQLGA